MIEDWRHYVFLLLEKAFAIPWVSALRQGALSPVWESARQELAARRPDGNHEFARLLELGVTHSLAAVEAALALPPDQQVAHPESGSARALYDCPAAARGVDGQLCRIIVTTHPAGEKKSRVGSSREGVVSGAVLNRSLPARVHRS